MIRLLIILFLICAGVYAPAQILDEKWLIGYSGGVAGADTFGNYYLEFSTTTSETTISDIFDSKMGAGATTAFIYNKEKNYMLYTNGCRLFNQNHEYVEGGDHINDDSDTGNLIWPLFCQDDDYSREYYPAGDHVFILPYPHVADKYWVCSTNIYLKNSWAPDSCITNKYFLALVDMSYNNYQGKVTDTFWITTPVKYIFNNPATCVHDNGYDWWICLPAYKVPGFVMLKLTNEGIVEAKHQNIGDLHSNSIYLQSVFSPDGKKYAFQNEPDGLQLYDFDDKTGTLSNHRHIELPGKGSNKYTNEGVAFSPNSRFLYAGGANLYQYDTDANDVEASIEKVGQVDTVKISKFPHFTKIGAMQLALNNKIYVTSGSFGSHLGTIHNPDVKGAACNFDPIALDLPSPNLRTLPTVNHLRNKKLKVATTEPKNIAAQIITYYKGSDNTINWEEVSFTFVLLNIISVDGKSLGSYHLLPFQEQVTLNGSPLPGMYFAIFEDAKKQKFIGKILVKK